VLSEKSCCVCAERIYRILSEFSLCCSSFGAVREVLLCFVQREYIGSCLNLACAVLHLVLSEKSCCVCAEGIYMILSEFSLCCSSFGAVIEVLLCLCRGNIYDPV